MTLLDQCTGDALPEGFEYRLDLAQYATPRELRITPRHKWFVFPHSYSWRLVNEILHSWRLEPGSILLDPFVGAGTTLVVAKDHRFGGIGYDISPFAVLATNVKVRDYVPLEIEKRLEEVLGGVDRDTSSPGWQSPRLSTAFSAGELAKLWHLNKLVQWHEQRGDTQPMTRRAQSRGHVAPRLVPLLLYVNQRRHPIQIAVQPRYNVVEERSTVAVCPSAYPFLLREQRHQLLLKCSSIALKQLQPL